MKEKLKKPYLLDLLPAASDPLVSALQPCIDAAYPSRCVSGLQAQSPLQVIAAANERHDAHGHEHGQHDPEVEVQPMRVTRNRGRQGRVVVVLRQPSVHYM